MQREKEPTREIQEEFVENAIKKEIERLDRYYGKGKTQKLIKIIEGVIARMKAASFSAAGKSEDKSGKNIPHTKKLIQKYYKEEDPEILEELKNIITHSDLTLIDQNDLLVFLPILPEKVLKDLVEIFKKDKSALEKFNANFKSKVLALTAQNSSLWDEILKKEEEELKEWSEKDKEELEEPIQTEQESEDNF